MADSGFTGISFPFRIGVKGGVVMSTTNIMDAQHIIESVNQILRTRPMERGMEYHFKSDIDTIIFEPNDSSARTLISYQVKEALRELEDRITVNSVDVISRDSEIIAVVTFTVNYYNSTHTVSVKVGDLNVENSK